MITAYYYYLLSMQIAREINNEEPINNRIGTTPFLAINFLKSAFVDFISALDFFKSAFLDFISTLGSLRSALCGFVESHKKCYKNVLREWKNCLILRTE